MAKFIGTQREFNRYIGPFLRNLVQQLTKRHKASVGACEHCGATQQLESAHVTGRERIEIIAQLLGTQALTDAVEVDLEPFEDEFNNEHNPIEKNIQILCRECHREYDRQQDQPAGADEISAGDPQKVLPILFEPSDLVEFKKILLVQKRAIIETHYSDGNVTSKAWNADKFSEKSNLIGNLRSRPEFRSGAWQSHGIACVRVKI